MAKKGENIRHRRDGRWEGRYIKGRSADGKAVWGYVFKHSYLETKQELIRRKAECAYYSLTMDNPTFEELAQMWLCSVEPGIKESTFSHYRYTLERYILPVLGSLNVKTMNEQILESGLRQILFPVDGSHKPLGHSAAKECLTMVRRICKYAHHLRLIRPLEIVVSLPKPSMDKTEPLSKADQKKVYDYVLENPTPRKTGLLLAVQMGLRIGEICGLQWGDFNLTQGVLTIQRTVQRISCGNGHTKVVIQTPKTRTSARQIPVPQNLLTVLRQLRGMATDDAWFLSGSSEKPVEPRCFRKSLHTYLNQAKVRSVRPHILRHTFASTCLQAGCDIKTISNLMGHADASITLQRYVHSDLCTSALKPWSLSLTVFTINDIRSSSWVKYLNSRNTGSIPVFLYPSAA